MAAFALLAIRCLGNSLPLVSMPWCPALHGELTQCQQCRKYLKMATLLAVYIQLLVLLRSGNYIAEFDLSINIIVLSNVHVKS
jgi:hypothetical protein